jgi:protein SCO1/2
MNGHRFKGGGILAFCLTVAAAAAARADQVPSATDPQGAIRYSQAAIGRQIGDYALLNQDGESVRLADYRGKPLVVNLVYTSCGDICPVVVETLSRAVGVAQQALGRDSFAVVTVGFDAARDTPARMKAFAASHGVDLPNWRFLSTDKATAARLASDLGFIFYASPRGFDHLAQTTVIDRDGRVYRQVYGADFKSPALVEPLKDLVFARGSRIAGLDRLFDRIRLFCTIYDPTRDRYRFSYAIFISIIGSALSLGAVGFVLIRAVIRLHRREARGILR